MDTGDTNLSFVRFAQRQDLATIQEIYMHARELQKARGQQCWPPFSPSSVLDEIDRCRLLCVMDRDAMAGVFSIAYDDSALWGDRERGEHVYIHRIAKSANAGHTDLLEIVLSWARAHCRQLGRSGLRMDTWASNTALIAIYERRGFHVIDKIHIGHDARLPPQYHQNDFVLLEELPGTMRSSF